MKHMPSSADLAPDKQDARSAGNQRVALTADPMGPI
jgi:hypothetical protein